MPSFWNIWNKSLKPIPRTTNTSFLTQIDKNMSHFWLNSRFFKISVISFVCLWCPISLPNFRKTWECIFKIMSITFWIYIHVKISNFGPNKELSKYSLVSLLLSYSVLSCCKNKINSWCRFYSNLGQHCSTMGPKNLLQKNCYLHFCSLIISNHPSKLQKSLC